MEIAKSPQGVVGVAGIPGKMDAKAREPKRENDGHEQRVGQTLGSKLKALLPSFKAKVWKRRERRRDAFNGGLKKKGGLKTQQ